MPWLSKEFAFTERLCLKASASFTNMLNRPNLADDFDHVKLNIASSGFGASGGFGQPSAARLRLCRQPHRPGFLRLDF